MLMAGLTCPAQLVLVAQLAMAAQLDPVAQPAPVAQPVLLETLHRLRQVPSILLRI